VPEAPVLDFTNLFFAAIEKINRGGGYCLLHEFTPSFQYAFEELVKIYRVPDTFHLNYMKGRRKSLAEMVLSPPPLLHHFADVLYRRKDFLLFRWQEVLPCSNHRVRNRQWDIYRLQSGSPKVAHSGSLCS
jgi:hypothetical protein